jgi:hypothetical protein
MLDGSDKSTFHALRVMRDVLNQNKKPIIIWAGAGVSKWCGYPTWSETAQDLHSEYLKSELAYNAQEGVRYLDSQDYPGLFDCLRNVNARRYHSKLVSLFAQRPSTPVYDHFVDLLSGIKPLCIVTTNVDESLEHHLPQATTVQRSDLERCLDLLLERRSFVAKLHGSISSVQSLVFTATEYKAIAADIEHLGLLKSLFLQSCVVFLGYGLKDKHILDLFLANSTARSLFGDGPHFAVLPAKMASLPESIKEIRYIPEPHADHRSANIVLDIIRTELRGRLPDSYGLEQDHKKAQCVSAYFISDMHAPIMLMSSERTYSDPSRNNNSPRRFRVLTGMGFEKAELPDKEFSPLHDLTVGLVSFDTVYVPVSCISTICNLIGPSVFSMLIEASVLRFVHFNYEPAVVLPNKTGLVGEVVMFECEGPPEWRNKREYRPPLTREEAVWTQMRLSHLWKPWKYDEWAKKLFKAIDPYIVTLDESELSIPRLTEGALLHPSVQQLLGISDATAPSQIPRWVAFSVLRLAHTILASCVCQRFAIPATKIAFGGEVLASAAFSQVAARDWADNVTSYIVSGTFNTDLGDFAASAPSFFQSILKFRDTQAGVDLRRELLGELASDKGGEFVAAVNAGLRRLVSTCVLEAARSRLSTLLVRQYGDEALTPAVWTNTRNLESITQAWRARSRQELKKHCLKLNVRGKDLCPCGSGETLRLCCARALRQQLSALNGEHFHDPKA